jgi:hypothetical protein
MTKSVTPIQGVVNQLIKQNDRKPPLSKKMTKGDKRAQKMTEKCRKKLIRNNKLMLNCECLMLNEIQEIPCRDNE